MTQEEKRAAIRQVVNQIQGIDHLITTVYIDGVPTAVDMTVRITQQNNKTDPFNILYYLEPEVVKILK